MLGARVGYPLGYSINMYLILELDNSFGTREGSLIGVYLANWLAGLLSLDKYCRLDCQWDFHLDTHLTLQILD